MLMQILHTVNVTKIKIILEQYNEVVVNTVSGVIISHPLLFLLH